MLLPEDGGCEQLPRPEGGSRGGGYEKEHLGKGRPRRPPSTGCGSPWAQAVPLSGGWTLPLESPDPGRVPQPRDTHTGLLRPHHGCGTQRVPAARSFLSSQAHTLTGAGSADTRAPTGPPPAGTTACLWSLRMLWEPWGVC